MNFVCSALWNPKESSDKFRVMQRLDTMGVGAGDGIRSRDPQISYRFRRIMSHTLLHWHEFHLFESPV